PLFFEAQAESGLLYVTMAAGASALVGTILAGVSNILDIRSEKRYRESKTGAERPSNGISVDEVPREMQKARDMRAQMVGGFVKKAVSSRAAVLIGISAVVTVGAMAAFGAPAAALAFAAAHPMLASAGLMFATAATGWLYGYYKGRQIVVDGEEDILAIRLG